MNPIADLELQLKADAGALRALARDLVGDRHVAEDLLQEAVQRTLQQPPRGRLGAWLQVVLRNLCLQHRRREQRRKVREQVAARPERVEAVVDVAARREALRAVTAAVFALEEPYHTTILLRYFEDLPPAAIAASTGTSLATVKSRLQRGLLLLRARLDRDAPRRQWSRALLVATGSGGVATTAVTTGALVMAGSIKFVSGAAAVAAAAALLWTLAGPDVAPPPPAAHRAHVAAVPASAAESAAHVPAEPRREVAIDEPPPAPALLHPFAFELQIGVFDRDGLPVEGAQLQLAPARCSLTSVPVASGANGFALAQWRGRQPTMEMVLSVEGQRLLRRVVVQAGVAQRIVVEGVPSRGSYKRLTRLDLKLEQLPMQREQLAKLERAPQRLALERLALEQERLAAWAGSDQVPAMQAWLHPHAVFGDRLLASGAQAEQGAANGEALAAYRQATVKQLAAVRAQNELAALALAKGRLDKARIASGWVKAPAGQPPATLAGIVSDEQGRPARNVTVCWGVEAGVPVARTSTDEQGAFVFEKVKPGWLELRAGGGDAGLWQERIFVAEGQQAHWMPQLRRDATIRGRALGGDGRPLHGWTVEVAGRGAASFDACTVREDGVFELPNQPGGFGTLYLRHGDAPVPLPVAAVPDVLPDSGELQIAFDANSARGQLQVALAAPDGIDGMRVEVRVWQEDSGRGACMQRAKGEPLWSISGLAAGWYRVEVGATHSGWIDAGSHWVDGKGPVDLGRLVLPAPGTAFVERAAGTLPAADRFEQQVCLRRPDCDVRVESAAAAAGSELQLPAGDYWLLWRDAAGRRNVREFTVRSGQVSRVDAR